MSVFEKSAVCIKTVRYYSISEYKTASRDYPILFFIRNRNLLIITNKYFSISTTSEAEFYFVLALICMIIGLGFN